VTSIAHSAPRPNEARAIVAAGDLNDGPGLDSFERHYLTHNVAGMIVGSPFTPQRMSRHGFVDQVAKQEQLDDRDLRQTRPRRRGGRA